MARYAIDAPTLVHLVDESVPIDASHQLVAPNSIRSEALELLLRDVRAGRRTEAEALVCHDRMTGRLRLGCANCQHSRSALAGAAQGDGLRERLSHR